MRRSIRTGGLALLGLALLATAGSAQTTKVYFTETQFGPPLQYEVFADGTRRTTFNTIPAADFLNQGLVWTPSHSQLYYCNQNGGIGSVMRVNANGTGRTFIVSGLQDARSIEADWANNHLYFIDRTTRILYRVNTDGTGISPLITGTDRIERLALDLANGKIYFGNSTQNSIERVDLDGTNRETVIGSPSVRVPSGICLDVAAGKIYWVDSAPTTNYVARCNTDGTGFEAIVDGPNATSGMIDIDMDPVSQRVYWVDNLGNNEVGFWLANTDGTGATRFKATGSSGGLAPTSIHVQVDPETLIPCADGTVNTGAGQRTDVLFVNGSAGNSLREVAVMDGVEILATINKPPSGGNGRYVIHGNLGRPSELSVTPLPQNIGSTCFPVLLRDGATPDVVANSARNYDLVGENVFFGTPTPIPSRAPATIIQRTSDPNLPPGTELSIQGAIFDPGSSVPRGVSITNMVTLIVQ